MIVDDSKLSRKKLTDFVQKLGYDVICEAIDGVDGLQKYKEFKPDYVLTDLEMPNMKGDELSQKILELDKNTKIILITTISDKKELLNALRIGVVEIIRKPVLFEPFKDTLKELMESSHDK